MKRAYRWIWLWVWAWLPLGVSAQTVQLQVDRGPYYVGTPIDVGVLAEGFGISPEPACEPEASAAGQLTLIGVTPNQTQSVVIINGQVQRNSSVKFRYRYQFLASEPGSYEIGPFRVKQGGTERITSSYRVQIRDVPRTDRIEVEMRLGAQATYVGGRLPVELEYRIDPELQQNLVRSSLRVPSLDLSEAFEIEPENPSGSNQVVELATASGVLELPAEVRKEQRDGRDWVVVSMRYSLLPLRAGRYEFAPASLIVDAGVRFTRDFFGGRRATQVEKFRALGEARTLEVKSVPSNGRPPSFAGAVGRGFSLEVRADRSVVQVGDPIELKLTLRGDGTLETAALPPLAAPGLLSESDFNVPVGELTGEVEGDAKTFTAVIRAKREGVTEIPGLAYSYFNPESETFETVESRPIALAVRPAEIVDATQVVAPGIQPAPSEEATPDRGTDGADRPRAGERGFDLGGLDLSIVREPDRLLATAGSASLASWLSGGLYLVSGVLLLGVFWERRRASADPEELRRRERFAAATTAAERARAQGNLEGVRALAAALREVRPLCDRTLAPRVDRLLAECEERIFAPASQQGDPAGLSELTERGVSLARELAEASR